MLFKKKELEIDIHKGQVKCEECRHWVDIEDAQKISVSSCGVLVKNVWKTAILGGCDVMEDFYDYDGIIYFCHLHKKPYDSISVNYEVPTGKESRTYYSDVPSTRIEVDENGVKVKPK